MYNVVNIDDVKIKYSGRKCFYTKINFIRKLLASSLYSKSKNP